MTFHEAYKKITKEYPKKLPKKYVFYNGYYVFLLVDKDKPNAPVFDAFYAVNKETGQIAAYQPTNDKNSSEFFKLWREKR